MNDGSTLENLSAHRQNDALSFSRNIRRYFWLYSIHRKFQHKLKISKLQGSFQSTARWIVGPCDCRHPRCSGSTCRIATVSSAPLRILHPRDRRVASRRDDSGRIGSSGVVSTSVRKTVAMPRWPPRFNKISRVPGHDRFQLNATKAW